MRITIVMSALQTGHPDAKSATRSAQLIGNYRVGGLCLGRTAF